MERAYNFGTRPEIQNQRLVSTRLIAGNRVEFQVERPKSASRKTSKSVEERRKDSKRVVPRHRKRTHSLEKRSTTCFSTPRRLGELSREAHSCLNLEPSPNSKVRAVRHVGTAATRASSATFLKPVASSTVVSLLLPILRTTTVAIATTTAIAIATTTDTTTTTITIAATTIATGTSITVIVSGANTGKR
ncbi:hypothetical protein HZH66_014361 [Vespula vulgaris]|uniref:Uncharacterized protein n=1 Tax=Vespula vulgaris TaxID=7454 RepID=A0A834J2L1_VESVU|nr:hypothetical protein HZH66_014361 [Vespula vulgaris]